MYKNEQTSGRSGKKPQNKPRPPSPAAPESFRSS